MIKYIARYTGGIIREIWAKHDTHAQKKAIGIARCHGMTLLSVGRV